jgi:hypothetical protein
MKKETPEAFKKYININHDGIICSIIKIIKIERTIRREKNEKEYKKTSNNFITSYVYICSNASRSICRMEKR